jgi:WD40 repeat protein
MSSLAFSPDGTALATGSRDLTARLWDVASGKERWSYRGYRGGPWVDVAFAPDGKSVAAIGWDDIIRLLDADTGKERGPLSDYLGFPHLLAVTPDSKGVITPGVSGSLWLWDVMTGREIRALRRPRRIVQGESPSIYCLQVTPDGKGLVVSDDQGVRLWDVSDPERPRAGELIGPCAWVALSSDGKNLAVLDNRPHQQLLRLLDIRTKKVLSQAENRTNGNLHFSPDGRMLAIGNALWLYDGRTLQKKFGWYHYPNAVVAFSPDGQLAVSHGDGGINVWEIASGRWVAPPGKNDEKDEDRKPSSYRSRLAAASAATLARVIELKENRGGGLAFSPDGRYLALGGWDRTVSLYDFVAGRVIHTFQGHDGWVVSLAFTPDGRRLISGSQDGTALVWDVQALPTPAVQEVKRSAQELDALWKRLAGSAAEADAAMRELAASPAQAVDLVRRSIKPAPRDQSERIARLIRDLDSGSFNKRERASAALMEMGEDTAAALRAALAGQPPEELRRRADALLARLKDKGPAPVYLRGLRAIRLLGWLGTPGARRLLEDLAAGAPGAERTRAAVAALACLQSR